MFKLDIKVWEPISPEMDYRVRVVCERDGEAMPSGIPDTAAIFLHAPSQVEGESEYIGVASAADLLRVPLDGIGEPMTRSDVVDMILPDDGSLLAARDEIEDDTRALVRSLKSLDSVGPLNE